MGELLDEARSVWGHNIFAINPSDKEGEERSIGENLKYVICGTVPMPSAGQDFAGPFYLLKRTNDLEGLSKRQQYAVWPEQLLEVSE